MGKFKVGDRVRLKRYSYGGEKGFEAIVSKVEFFGYAKTWWYWLGEKRAFSSDGSFPETDLELVSPVWVPKVGDRVRSLVDWCDVKKGNDYSVEEISGTGVWVKVTGAYNHFMDFKEIEPPTVTIEPGKFYKTRDGRKVGPVVVAQGNGEPWPWKLESGTHYYKEDGHSCPGYAHRHDDKDDLIAEWQEPAATAAVVPSAQVDALAEEYGPAATPHPWKRYAVTEPVEVAASSDNSRDLTITISTDAAQTNEALDEIITKLKKIRKLQREVGIAA